MAYIYINPVTRDGGGEDAWAAFRPPEFNAAQMTQQDAPAITSQRAGLEVPSTAKVIGDREAEAAGLYETPKSVKTESFKKPDQWAQFRPQPPQQVQPQGPAAPFAQRFQEGDQRQEMLPALAERAAAMTQGVPTSPAQSMDISQSNILPAATQGTSPNVSDYGGRLVSTETFQSDSGEILYRDPSTGQLRPTDSKTQVALRDPADNTIKVFERSPDTTEMGATGVARVLAPGLAAGAPTARAMLPLAPKSGTVKASDIYGTAKPYYREFKLEASKIGVPPETAAGIGERLRRALDKINLDPELAGQPAKSAIGRLENPSEPMTLDYLQRVKRVASKGFTSPDKNIRDGASVLSSEINKVISEVSPVAGYNLGKADEIASTSFGIRDIQRAQDIAGLRAGRAGYGGNAVNSMRQLLSPIVQKSIEGKVSGFKPNEIAAMRDIVEGTTATNRARLVGQLSPSKGGMATLQGLSTGAGLGAGGAMLGGAGIASASGIGLAAAPLIPAIGAASNKLATFLTGKQIDRLRELVAKRSPAYAEAVAKSVDRWERAQAEVLTNPTPAKWGAYVSASRQLSGGLARDGVQVTAGDLLKMIQGPMKGAADEDQQPVPGSPGQ